MNTITTIVILVIIAIVAFKNWDKIEKIIGKRKNKTNNKEIIELSRKEIKQKKEDMIQTLINEKEKLKQEIEEITHERRKKIKKIDVELCILEGKG